MMGEEKEDKNEVEIELVAKDANKASDAEEGDGSKKKLTVLEFTKKAFRDSMLTGVSNIVNSDSIPRKTYKSVVLLLCLFGFTYQITVFFQDVFNYPTTMTVNIERPLQFIRPAFTFCHNNLIMKSKFCKKFPDECMRPDDIEEFCKAYPFYYDCKIGSQDFEIPDIGSEVFGLELNFQKEQLQEYGHDLGSLLINDSDKSEAVKGPFLMSKDFVSRFGCYTKYARFLSPLPPKIYERELFPSLEAANQFIFNPEESEYMSYHGRAGIYFAIHSPFESVNPHLRGTLLRPGRAYKIFVKLQEERLMPYPYDTNCLNYTDRWLKNNRTGIRSQEMCRQKCVVDASIACFGCVVPALSYPGEEFCSFNHTSVIILQGCDNKKDEEELEECLAQCKDDCKITKYIYDVKERLPSGSALSLYSKNLEGQDSDFITVDVYFDDPELVVFNFKPEYQFVEVFSYIGGFLGIWLGFCLISIADFFESLFDICRYIFRMRKRD